MIWRRRRIICPFRRRLATLAKFRTIVDNFALLARLLSPRKIG
jgi:hypothetical protein